MSLFVKISRGFLLISYVHFIIYMIWQIDRCFYGFFLIVANFYFFGLLNLPNLLPVLLLTLKHIVLDFMH